MGSASSERVKGPAAETAGATGRGPVRCPKCGTDALMTGWTVEQMATVSYMRFTGCGALAIARTERAAEKATCMCCGAKLGKTPAEMMRAA